MKRIWLMGAMLLAWPAIAPGAAQFYVNDGVVIAPPMTPPVIDATNFVNNNWFQIDAFLSEPYETTSTIYYTNRGTMIGQTGFRFETAPPDGTARRRAGTVSNSGRIDAGTKLLVNATNVQHRGVINMGFGSLMSVVGRDLDFNRGTVNSTNQGSLFIRSGTNLFSVTASSVHDGYWNANIADGVNGSPVQPIQFNFLPSFTPFHLVTNRDYSISFELLSPPNQVAYVNDVLVDASNRVVTAVFLGITNPAFTVSVYFRSARDPWVEWRSVVTNQLGQLQTNWIYLRDTFGSDPRLAVAPNGTAGPRVTFKPVNYQFSQPNSPLPLGPPAAPGLPSNTFDGNPPVITNEFTAYAALFEATTELLPDVVGRNVTNLSGRIELRAEGTLNLSNAQISALNYTLIQATNHFIGSQGAKIVSPWLDIHLRRTNGNLLVTNLVAPFVPKPDGVVRLWSARWTNDVAGVTNEYHVLFVDSALAPTLTPRIQSLTLRCTNNVGGGGEILISDPLIETERLTLTTNTAGSLSSRGEINLLSGNLLWPTATPRLRYLTNNGALTSLNAVFFGGSRFSPFFSTNFNEPYGAMVNRGDILNYGSLIWADYFENRGLIQPYLGSVEIFSTNALLRDGMIATTNGDIAITSGSLVITNHVLDTARSLSLDATNLLDDGALANLAAAPTNITTLFVDPTSALLNTSVAMISNKNYWIAGDGVALWHLPPQASLLGTTIEARAQANRQVFIFWAGQDRGCVSAGFSNNAALGRLILDGAENSLFTFAAAGVSNALYVDRIELMNYSTNRDVHGEFIGLEVLPGFKVYYAEAVMNGVSVAEKLNGRSGGGFCWVNSFAGFFSSTNVIYPDGTTNTFNAALIGSPDLDSDGDGTENRSDPTPILRPQDIALTVTILRVPTPRVEVAWQTLPNAINHVYYKTSLGATNWVLLTNFVSGPVVGRVSIQDPVQPNSPRYYRVRVEMP